MEDSSRVDTGLSVRSQRGDNAAVRARCGTPDAMSFGYAELTGRPYFNTCILTDKSANIIGKYRKVHLPGHSEFDTERAFQHLEKRLFPNRRYRLRVWRRCGGIIGMRSATTGAGQTLSRHGPARRGDGMLGYNTPAVNAGEQRGRSREAAVSQSPSCSPGAYQNATWSWQSPKPASRTAFHSLQAGLIVDPNGEIVAEASTEGDEILVHPCDLDRPFFGKKTIFDFARHRRIEHYA